MRFRSLKRWLIGSFSVSVFAALLLLCGSPGVETAAPPQPARADEKQSWPMFGGSPARNMVNLTAKNLPVEWDNDPKAPKNILWSADLGSRAYGGPIVAAGKVFVGTNNQNPRNPRYRTVRLTEWGDIVTHVKGEPVKDAKDIEQVMAGLPADTRDVECTYVSGGFVRTNRLAVIPVDLGVLMVFNQADGKFLYQTVFAKLANGQVGDWPLEGICSAPTVEGDKLYYTSNRCEVICADVNTGAFVWKVDMIGQLGVFPHNMTACSPLIVGNDLYVITSNGVDEGHINIPAPTAPSFLKLDKKTGKVLWQDNSPTIKAAGIKNLNQLKAMVDRGEIVQHGQWSHPAYAVVNGQPQIIFPGGDGWIRSYTPAGNLIWKFDCNPKNAAFVLGGRGTRSDFIAAPVIYKNRVYIGLGQDPEHLQGVGHFWCIDMDKKGDVSPDLVVNAAAKPPVIAPNPNSAKVCHFGGFVQGKVANGARKWHFGRTMGTCAIHDDLVYVSEWEGLIHCLDANTGKLYWQHDLQSQVWPGPYWADGKVYQGTDTGDVWVFAHGKEKKILAQNEMGYPVRTGPVAVGEVLYVSTGKKLYALKK